jgi:PAS domain-containing protein
VGRPRPKNLVLIVARELASNLATPIFVVDDRGAVVFFNEPAEAILGQRFSDLGEVSAEEWRQLFQPESPDGTPLGLGELPSTTAFRERRPAHGTLTIRGLDGVRREISSTGLPLFARGREFVGVVAIFWQLDATDA